MIAKVLVSAAIVLGAAVGIAAPALADPTTDPSPFGGIGCSDPTGCQGKLVVSQMPNPEQVTPAIQQGLAALQAEQ